MQIDAGSRRRCYFGRKKKTEAQEPQSLEENFSAVEELIGQLEAEDISLEEALRRTARA